MKEQIIEVEFLNPVTKEGYIKIPPQIRRTYKLRTGDVLIVKIMKKIVEGDEK